MKDSTLCLFRKGKGLFIQKSIDNVRDWEKMGVGDLMWGIGPARPDFLERAVS